MLAFVLGEVLAVIQFNIVFLFIVPVGILIIKIITKKRTTFFVVIFLFLILGELITQNEIREKNKFYRLKEEYTTVYGIIEKISKNSFGYNIYIKNPILHNEKHKRILVYSSDIPNIKIGQNIKIKGKLVHFESAENKGNFDSKFYYMTQGIYIKIDCEELAITNKKYDFVRNSLYNVKKVLSANFNKICGNKASMFIAVLLGDKSSMDKEIKSLYSTSGIAHILAISGLHISFIGMFVYKIFRKKFRFALSSAVSFSIVLLFGIMSGMGIATIRAVIMFALRLLGEVLGCTYDYLTAISLAGIILIMDNPFVILNSGFQMSFMAIISITIIFPYVKKIIKISNKLIETIICSLNITIIMMPIIAYNYFQLPTFSFLLNLIIIPLLSVVIITGIAGVTLSFVSITIGRIVIFLGCIIWDIYNYICNIVSKIPYSNIIVGKPPIWKIVVYYLIIVLALIVGNYFRNKQNKKENKNKKINKDGMAVERKSIKLKKDRKLNRKYIKAYIIIIVLITTLIYIPIPKGFQITFMDVGQGDGIAIHMPDGNNITIDGGSTTVKNPGENRIICYLKAEGTRKIKYAIVTHCDEDHINGLRELLGQSGINGIKIENLVLPDVALKDEAFNNLKGLAIENKVNVLYISTGATMKFENVEIKCIYPKTGFVTQDRNDYSTVLSLKYNQFSVLFTGDISTEMEPYLNRKLLEKYTVLKVAHHGSKYSTSTEFLRQIKPMYSVISSGKNNMYGHPHKDTIERLQLINAKILRTDQLGSVIFYSNGNNVTIESKIK